MNTGKYCLRTYPYKFLQDAFLAFHPRSMNRRKNLFSSHGFRFSMAWNLSQFVCYLDEWIILLRLVSTSDGVGVGVVKALMTWWKSKIGVVSGVRSATESESELESERLHFLPTPLTTLSLNFRLWSRENQIVGVGSRRGRINQSQCTFPRPVIG